MIIKTRQYDEVIKKKLSEDNENKIIPADETKKAAINFIDYRKLSMRKIRVSFKPMLRYKIDLNKMFYKDFICFAGYFQ